MHRLAGPVLRSVTCCSWLAPCSHSKCSASVSSEIAICGTPSCPPREAPRMSLRACRVGAFCRWKRWIASLCLGLGLGLELGLGLGFG